MRFYHSRPSFGYIFESDASIFHLVKFQENIFLSTRIIFCCHMKVSCILFNDDDDDDDDDNAYIISCCHVKVHGFYLMMMMMHISFLVVT